MNNSQGDSIRELRDGQRTTGSVNEVARRGSAVVRPAGEWTSAVHGLLRHLESVEFSGSPRVLGMETDGREVLTYLEGEVAKRPWPECLTADSGIKSLVTFVKDYHRAVTPYTPSANSKWRLPETRWNRGQIIRHGDLAPWNMVWNRGQLVGLIDWDFAEPGSTLEDIAQLAWHSVPLYPPDKCIEAGIEPMHQQYARFRLLCDTFGVGLTNVLNGVISLQDREIARTIQLGAEGVVPWDKFLRRGDAEKIRQERAWLTSVRVELLTM